MNIPNQETIEALKEKETMKDKKKYKRYDSFKEIIKETESI